MTAISDQTMREALTKTKVYSVMVPLAGPNRHQPDADKIIWEHGRRNFERRRPTAGTMFLTEGDKPSS